MGEEKFASLSSGLLARKGTAKPAMRRQGYINPHGDVADDLGWNDMGYEPPRPIGPESDHPDAELPEVRRQLDGLAEEYGSHAVNGGLTPHVPGEDEWNEAEEVEAASPLVDDARSPLEIKPARKAQAERARSESAAAKASARSKAAFTLRLDKDRHLKLRLASAVTGQSAQKLVTEALDALLATMPELDSMAPVSARKDH